MTDLFDTVLNKINGSATVTGSVVDDASLPTGRGKYPAAAAPINGNTLSKGGASPCKTETPAGVKGLQCGKGSEEDCRCLVNQDGDAAPINGAGDGRKSSDLAGSIPVGERGFESRPAPMDPLEALKQAREILETT